MLQRISFYNTLSVRRVTLTLYPYCIRDDKSSTDVPLVFFPPPALHILGNDVKIVRCSPAISCSVDLAITSVVLTKVKWFVLQSSMQFRTGRGIELLLLLIITQLKRTLSTNAIRGRVWVINRNFCKSKRILYLCENLLIELHGVLLIISTYLPVSCYEWILIN